MRKVYHHLSDRVEYFRKVRRLLKQEGRVAIIEYERAKPFTFRGVFGHYLPKEIIAQEMKEAEYRVLKKLDFLPNQSFILFSA
jgi:ubiquinone/menaquinone biosynthesis C-methylase UbiE